MNNINIEDDPGEDLIEFTSIKGEKSSMQRQFFNSITISKSNDSSISLTYPSGFTQVTVTKTEAIRVAQRVFGE